MTNLNYNLQGKYALVTGGTHGIGLAICEKLAHYGCKIAFMARSQDTLIEISKKFKEKNVEHLYFQADALSEEDCNSVMDQIETEWGRLDILVNNVGGGGRWGRRFSCQ